MTRAEGGWLDRLLDAANARGIAVYLQVMAASPPGYRVQFSNALADDACLGPDGQPHGQRVDRNASLASSHVVAYITTLLIELASRYPGVAGFRLDWPEYPPYDFRSALFDFNPAALAQVRAGRPRSGRAGTRGHGLGAAIDAGGSGERRSRLARDARCAARRGMGLADSRYGPLRPLFDAKRAASLSLLRACRAALDTVPGARRRLEPQIFPPPLHRISGFPIDALDGVADAVGVKLYTMHWPMLARYWARDLLAGAGGEAEQNALTAAIADLFGFTDALDKGGAALRYPEPHEAHPVGARAQSSKLLAARELAGVVPVRAFVHSYGPSSDVMARFDIAARRDLPRWINRYGYLSDQKLEALRGGRLGTTR